MTPKTSCFTGYSSELGDLTRGARLGRACAQEAHAPVRVLGPALLGARHGCRFGDLIGMGASRGGHLSFDAQVPRRPSRGIDAPDLQNQIVGRNWPRIVFQTEK
jgi:hypothetical protein